MKFCKEKETKKRLALYLITYSSIFIIFWNCIPNPIFTYPTCTVLEDKDNKLLGAHISDDGQWRFPKSDSIPEKFKKAIIAFEDKRFYNHIGVDPVSMCRALISNIKSNKTVSGGSTITMQTIRLSRKGKPRTLFEKVIEIIQATRVELTHSKDEILNLYASNAPFGGNVVGIEAAGWRYYGRSPFNLSWAETALLAVLPNSPSLIHPGKNRDKLLNKRNRLLKKLYLNRDISKETYDLSLDEPIPEKPLSFPQFAHHLLFRANSNLNEKGTKIKSTIDLNIQIRVNSIINDHHISLSGNGIHNAVALVKLVKL